MRNKPLRHRRIRYLLTAVACAFGCLLPMPGAAARQADPAAGPKAAAVEYQQVTLAKGVAETGEPMTLAVLPDRSVLHTSRDGTVRLTNAAGTTTVAGKLDVYSHDEEGLQGVAVDPGFASNGSSTSTTPPSSAPRPVTPRPTARPPTSPPSTGSTGCPGSC